MPRVIDRIRARLAKTVAPAAAAPAADAGLAYVLTDPAQEARPRTLISFLAEPPDNIGEIVISVAYACELRGEYPVLVMSELRAGLIAASTVPIEFMPTRRHLPFDPDEYERYVGRRWSLMMAKWSFTRQIDLDRGFEEFVADQRPSGQLAPA